jgi:hypothetical protein
LSAGRPRPGGDPARSPRRPTGVAFAELTKLVAGRISKADQGRLGEMSWHTMTVKLELEARGEIEPVPGQSVYRDSGSPPREADDECRR